MDQFIEPETEPDLENELGEVDIHKPWTMRILAILLILIFLFPLLLSAFQTVMRFLQPQIIPTPFGLENLLHG